ncbi:MAG: inorganic phosphate transporter [Bacteroidales bacterium]|nr:inorganic phosphate transporter [Bacteroidales bacterium]
METIYLVIVVILFLLAASDLIVGVSNDAVNFLNSAIGSKVASFRVIMAVAAVGILFGAVFSSGMMEVARKGIFNPGMFYFTEIMIIFMAVMITDVILLDVYNTAGLPTSTTVSIVFELLGAAVAMASIKLFVGDSPYEIGDFINSSKALAIISGILLSVGIAFTVGAIIQYITRLAFSFDLNKSIKYLGALWGGIAFTAMTYFILIKGAKGASFMSDDIKEWIHLNSGMIMLYSFFGWTILLQLLYWLFRINILKLIVLIGTFSLAMAFAGNDLVNFIGVPIAGYNSYELLQASGSADPGSLLMDGLSGKVPTPIILLIIAGFIMVITLFVSKKAKSVIRTSLDLSRQDEGDERFRSTRVSKLLVRGSLSMSNGIRKVLPAGMVDRMQKQFEPHKEEKEEKDPPMFDLVRASVNLTVASVLIAFGTSLKLPLSTTYVTFMVAMGTSLADNAWDRESAVYRISGVFAVIGGWFLTAISAFTVAFIMVYLFHFGELYAIFGMVLVVIYIIYRTHGIHKKAAEQSEEKEQSIDEISEENIAAKSTRTIIRNLQKIIEQYANFIDGIEAEDVKKLKSTKKDIDKITSKTKYLKDHLNVIVDKLREESMDTAYYFVEVLDYMREMLHSISFIVGPAFEHVDNNHKPLLKEQVNELRELHKLHEELLNKIIKSMETSDFSSQQEILKLSQLYMEKIAQVNKKQIRRLKNAEVGTKNTMLFLNLVSESKQLVLQAVNLYKSHRDFIDFNSGS